MRHGLKEDVRPTTGLARASDIRGDVFRRFAEACGEGLVMTDLDARITYVNPTLCRRVGEDRPEDAIGKALSQYYAHQHRRHLDEEVFPTALRDGGWTGELTLRTSEGHETPTLESFALVRDAEGNPAHFAVVVTDITERKRTEETIRKYLCSMQRIVRAQGEDRQPKASESYDRVAQHLSAAMTQFDAFEQEEETIRPEAHRAYQAGRALLKRAHAEASRLLAGFRPSVLDRSGLIVAIAQLAADATTQGGPEVEFTCSVQFDRLNPMPENAIFRTVEESLANLRQLGESPKAKVKLVQSGSQLELEIQGLGIRSDLEEGHENRFGFSGISARARMCGGHAAMRSCPGGKITLAVRVPISIGGIDID